MILPLLIAFIGTATASLTMDINLYPAGDLEIVIADLKKIVGQLLPPILQLFNFSERTQQTARLMLDNSVAFLEKYQYGNQTNAGFKELLSQTNLALSQLNFTDKTKSDFSALLNNAADLMLQINTTLQAFTPLPETAGAVRRLIPISYAFLVLCCMFVVLMMTGFTFFVVLSLRHVPRSGYVPIEIPPAE